MRDNGSTAKEISDRITELVPKVRLFAIFDTLKYLVRGGRISKTAGAIGGALGVKPLITVADGAVLSIGTARGMKNAYEKLANIVEDADIDTELPMVLTFSHNQENMLNFEAYMIDRGLKYNWGYAELGSVIATHAGPGALAAIYFVK